jgi:hypothetical protein
VIAKGETHTHIVGKWEGDFGTYRVCAHCRAAGEWLNVACGGWMFGGIGEELGDHWDEEIQLRSVMLARLILGHRRRWRDGLDPVPDREQVRASVPAMATSA